MGTTLEGSLNGRGLRFGLVASRFNDFVVKHLIEGAQEALRKCGVEEGNMDLVRVPGAMEIPTAAKQLAESGAYDAILCLGCVIRGGTTHYDLVCGEAAKGIAQVGLQTGVPAIFAVIAAETLEQAIERSGAKLGNKGYEGALAAVEMATLAAQLRAPRRGRRKRP
ncbi:MAG: 6,7-dimethyl-8-ribityllumazine synthase [Nitrospinota bacterium]